MGARATADRADLRDPLLQKRAGFRGTLGLGVALHARVATLSTPLGRLQALFLANLVLQILDGWVTLAGISRGLPEGNPLVATAMSSIGPIYGVAGVKLMAIGLLFLIYRRHEHRFVEPGLMSLAITYTLFAVVPWTVVLARTPG